MKGDLAKTERFLTADNELSARGGSTAVLLLALEERQKCRDKTSVRWQYRKTCSRHNTSVASFWQVCMAHLTLANPGPEIQEQIAPG